MNKRLLCIILISLLCVFVLFADEKTEKVRLHRTQQSAFHIDFGGIISVPQMEVKKRLGLFGGAAITPIRIKKLAAGAKGEIAIHVPTDIMNVESKKESIAMDISLSLIAKYPIARSFELYAGGGARYQIKEFKGFSDFGQSWGWIIQGGARGRANDWFGIGAELNYFFNVPDDYKALDIIGYFTIEF